VSIQPVEDLIADSQINADLLKVQGVQSEKNYCVLVTPLVQSSAPTSLKSSRATPVSYFESLTPDLRDSDDEWDYKDIEGISTSDDSSSDYIPNPINNISKKPISSNIKVKVYP
jgi:hypothetical protein